MKIDTELMDIITAFGYVSLIAGIIVESVFLFIAGIISLIVSMALFTISGIPDNSDCQSDGSDDSDCSDEDSDDDTSKN